MHRCEVDRLDRTRSYWVPAVASPCRNWPGAPGCRKGARFLVDQATLRAGRNEFGTFDSRLSCLSWIMHHRTELSRALPGATIRPVALDRWLLGLD